MPLKTSKKPLLPLVLFLILSFCQLILSFSLAFSTSQAEGISAFEVCEKDRAIPFMEELGISEDIYSLPCLSLITALQKQEGYSVISLVPALSENPPTV